MATTAKAVANYFLSLAKKEGKALNPMQVQKLVYFAHGWYLAIFGQPLIKEDVQAWSWGPVIPSLYHAFKKFGNGPIEEPASESIFAGMKFQIKEPSIEDMPNAAERERTKTFLDRVWQVYSHFTGIQLSNLTHQDDSPWKIALDQSRNARGTVIPSELIREYFSRQAEQNARERRAAG